MQLISLLTGSQVLQANRDVDVLIVSSTITEAEKRITAILSVTILIYWFS